MRDSEGEREKGRKGDGERERVKEIERGDRKS